MKITRRARRTALAAFLAGCSTLPTTGCTTGGMSLASLNPFQKSTDTVASTPSTTTGVTGKLAAMRQTATGQVSSMGMATKSAYTKTKNSVTGLFGGKKTTTDASGNPIATDDPTRLDSPASVGPDVFVAQGQLWETTGDFQKAMQSYTRALETEPNNAAALASIARLHFRQENYQPAADYFRRAMEKSPNDPGLHNDYGLTQVKLGDTAGAIQSISKALTLAPGTSRYANNLADAKYNSGDVDGALAVLLQHNKPAVAHFNMAFLHYKAGRLPEAKNHLYEVVKYEPQAASDSAVGKAVSRSKEMLASLDGPASRIAQAAPQAYAAAEQFAGAFQQQQQQPVQQTAQLGGANVPPATQAAAVAPAATTVSPWATPTAPIATTPAPAAVTTPVAPPALQPATTTPPTSPTSATPQTPYTLPPGFFNQ
ncbi:MAG: tetratricopeptide repeat protein [Planctomycetaceae bacterium]